MLIWADPYEHYGILDDMALGAYAELHSPGGANVLSLDTGNPRNGSTCLRCQGQAFVRRTLGDAYPTIGFASALFIGTALPADGSIIFGSPRDLSNNYLGIISQTSDGRIRVYRGNFSALLGTSNQVLAVGAYQHIEWKWVTDSSNGSVEVRVNGETVLDITGVSTAGAGDGINPGQIVWGQTGGANSIYFDDTFAWNGEGDYVNDFMGDHRVRLAKLISDTAQAEWVPNVTSATGFEMLTEIPNDGDITHIAADEPYMSSEFEFEGTPDDVASIAGIMLVSLERKTDAGACSTQKSLVSGISEGLGADNPLTQPYSYYEDPMVVDPNTGAPFLPADLGGSGGTRLKITRTA